MDVDNDSWYRKAYSSCRLAVATTYALHWADWRQVHTTHHRWKRQKFLDMSWYVFRLIVLGNLPAQSRLRRLYSLDFDAVVAAVAGLCTRQDCKHTSAAADNLCCEYEKNGSLEQQIPAPDRGSQRQVPKSTVSNLYLDRSGLWTHSTMCTQLTNALCCRGTVRSKKTHAWLGCIDKVGAKCQGLSDSFDI